MNLYVYVLDICFSKMIESIISLLLERWLFALAVFVVAYFARNYFYNGLQKYPGPFLAAFTNWWRFWDVLERRPDRTQLRLHRELGDIVRIGPNTLSVADPKALKIIYGLNKGFVKVRVARSKSFGDITYTK